MKKVTIRIRVRINNKPSGVFIGKKFVYIRPTSYKK